MPCRVIRITGPTADDYQAWRAMGYTGTWEQYAADKALSAGQHVMICGPAVRDWQQCSCGALAGYLCDYLVGHGRTCDRPLCSECAAHGRAGKDIHYCPDHLAAWERWLVAGGCDVALLARLRR